MAANVTTREWTVAAALYVLGSTVLGLSFLIAVAGLDSFVKVWAASFGADLVFVVGTVAAGFGAVYVTRFRTGALWSFLVGLVGNWSVYALSFSMLGGATSSSGDFDFASQGNAFSFVGRFGFTGLFFCAFAPLVWTNVRGRKASTIKVDVLPAAPAPSPPIAAVPSHLPPAPTRANKPAARKPAPRRKG